jgi:hypothetical protein
MGQSHSTRHRLLQNAKDVDWESVLSEEWRSEKSRELDKWGGKWAQHMLPDCFLSRSEPDATH